MAQWLHTNVGYLKMDWCVAFDVWRNFYLGRIADGHYKSMPVCSARRARQKS